jgi:hypothetical protein
MDLAVLKEAAHPSAVLGDRPCERARRDPLSEVPLESVALGRHVEDGDPAHLVHELAHALVRANRQDDDPELDAAAEELVAETTVSCSGSRGCRPGCWASRG